jgi:hypothetical protein
MSVCPYAKGADYKVVNTDGSDIFPPPWKFDLYIYVLPDHYSQQMIIDIAAEYNTLYPDLVFLPDPKDRYTEINGLQTNNGEKNIILCQWRDDLMQARKKLAKTKYYQHWAADYLKEILTT